MFASLGLAVLILAQEPSTLDGIIDRHQYAASRATTFDELAALARQALASIVKLLDSKPDAAVAARARAIAADICADLEDYDGAESHARIFLETWPKHEQAPLMKMTLGQIRTAAGRDPSAREAFQSVIQDHPQDERVPEARLRIAQSFVCEGRDEDAHKAFTELRAAHKGKPVESSIAMQHAIALQIAGRAGEGRAIIEEVVRTCPEPRTVDAAKRVLATWLWIGKQARPVEGWDLKGAPAKLDLTSGKVTVFYFTGAAFPDFEAEAGVMRRLAKRFAPADVSILAVSIDKEKAKAEAAAARVGVTWPVLFDGNGFKGPIASSFDLDTLPMVLLIDRKNAIRYVNPVFSDHGREIGRCVSRLVSEK